MVPTFDGGDAAIGIGSPDEGFGIFVLLGEEAVDRGLQVDERMEHTAFEPPAGELGEKSFDGVEPGT